MFVRKLIAVAVVSAVSGLSAQAADIYRREAVGGYKDGPAYVANTWTGFYIGAHVGGAFDDLTITDVDGFTTGGPGRKTSLSPSGVIAGGTLGYNWQSGPVVFGVEGDIGYLGLNESKLLTLSTANTRAGIEDGLYGDITGRLGYAFGPALLYAKGGFAFYDGGEKFSTNVGGTRVSSSLDTLTGYTIGGGLEYKINPAWSIKGEYQYFDFGDETFTVTTTNGSKFRFKEELNVQTVKFGVNYSLAREYEPLK
jgi:outer membrane immunogenic protein